MMRSSLSKAVKTMIPACVLLSAGLSGTLDAVASLPGWIRDLLSAGLSGTLDAVASLPDWIRDLLSAGLSGTLDAVASLPDWIRDLLDKPVSRGEWDVCCC